MKNKDKGMNQSLEKLKIITNIIIILLLIFIIIILQKNGIIENTLKRGKYSNKKLLNNEEILVSEDGKVNSSNWDTSKITIYKDVDGKEVPVPKGYVGSSVTGENKVNEGYVIYEGNTEVTSSNVSSAKTTRNQWVWIPVVDARRIYEEVNGVKKAKLYTFTYSGRSEYVNNNYEPAVLPEFDTITNLESAGLTGMTPDKLYQELQQEFDSTMESIEKYGGFYIGRYETGNLSQTKPVVKQMNADIFNKAWYKMYSTVGYLAENESVKTNIIWGCLWDETLQWLEDRGNKYYPHFLNFSTAWGNYPGIFGTKGIPTGSSEYTKALNIYDLAGNAWEWTLEGSGTSYRILRGGGYDTVVEHAPVSVRLTMFSPNNPISNTGYRAYLYIK